MVESLRQDTVMHEIDSVAEVEFPSPAVAAEHAPDQPAPGALPALQLLWEKRRMLYRVAAWALVSSTVIAFLIPKQYESSVSIMPPDSMNSSGTMLAALATKASPELAAMAGGLLGAKGSGALFVDLFRSRSVQDHVVDRLNLQKVYWSRYHQDARKKLNSRTGVSEDRKSGVITLTVTDRSPQRAHDIAQAYVEELDRLVSQVSTSSARRERVFIEGRLATVKGDLEDAEKQFGAFASKNSTLDIKEQTKAMVESAGVLQGQLIASQSELQSLEQIYTSSNVRVRSLQARVDELKRQLQKLEGTDASLASDAAQPDQLYPPIRKLPLLGVEWADLYRRMKIQETVYELLNQQYELARIQEAKEIPTVNVADPANVPEKKSFPPRLVIILALTLLAACGATAWIIGSARWEQIDPQNAAKMFAESVWNTASNRGTVLLNRLATLRRRKQSPEDSGLHSSGPAGLK
jgi:capsule polysaccharide export protein KpsE/RkpR